MTTELTRDEAVLLLYLETRFVDHGGIVDVRKMNADDMAIARRWNEAGFLEFGRIAFRCINQPGCSSYVVLSDEAWKVAGEERRNRAERLFKKRTWIKTTEK